MNYVFFGGGVSGIIILSGQGQTNHVKLFTAYIYIKTIVYHLGNYGMGFLSVRRKRNSFRIFL